MGWLVKFLEQNTDDYDSFTDGKNTTIEHKIENPLYENTNDSEAIYMFKDLYNIIGFTAITLSMRGAFLREASYPTN